MTHLSPFGAFADDCSVQGREQDARISLVLLSSTGSAATPECSQRLALHTVPCLLLDIPLTLWAHLQLRVEALQGVKCNVTSCSKQLLLLQSDFIRANGNHRGVNKV